VSKVEYMKRICKGDIYGGQLESVSRRDVASESKCEMFKTVTNVSTYKYATRLLSFKVVSY
jgi:hypothetical protein